MAITPTELSLTANGLSSTSIEIGAKVVVVTVVATTWSTAQVQLRVSLVDSAGNFGPATAVPNPYLLPTVIPITFNGEDRYPVTLQGPLFIRGFVSNFGSASGLKIQVA